MFSSSTTIFRVRRKRSADPPEALVISLKRAKQTVSESVNEPVICLRTTESALQVGLKSITSSQQINVIDVDPNQDSVNSMELEPANMDDELENSDHEDSDSTDNPLKLFQNTPEASSSRMVVGEMRVRPSQITLNGEPMAVLSGYNNEEFIFDYYWSSKADGCTARQIHEVRLANSDDLMLYDGEETESSIEDDDEDSNAENNLRNDYPDESDHTSKCGSSEDISDDFDADESCGLHSTGYGFDELGSSDELSHDDYNVW